MIACGGVKWASHIWAETGRNLSAFFRDDKRVNFNIPFSAFSNKTSKVYFDFPSLNENGTRLLLYFILYLFVLVIRKYLNNMTDPFKCRLALESPRMVGELTIRVLEKEKTDGRGFGTDG